MSDLEQFKSKYNLHDKDLLIFPYGSRVYGTASEGSDYDYHAILLEDTGQFCTGQELVHGTTNIHIYTAKDWQKQLHEHKIHALEAHFLPNSKCDDYFYFRLDIPTLRASLSEKASHSFVKAKKKIDKERDYMRGWKSLFHSLRILIFGTQIAEMGKIEDYSAANHYWFEILNEPHYEWDWYKEKYQPVYNELATAFRQVAKKE